MKIFLDTEFTDFSNSQLISLGLVDENGREFYAESTSFNREDCSQFVIEIVLPLLGQYSNSIVGTNQHIAFKLQSWLEQYRDTGATICVDYHTDWDLFIQLLNLLPKHSDKSFITGEMIWSNLNLKKIEQWWQETQLPQHMALYDAQANRHGYEENQQ